MLEKRAFAAIAGFVGVCACIAVDGCGPLGTQLRGSREKTTKSRVDASVANDDEPFDPPPPPVWSEGPGTSAKADPHTKFASAKTCAGCHRTIYDQWASSMHARGLRSPVTIAQANQAARPLANEGSPDPRRICINCHAPTAANVSTSATLPLEPAALGDEGVSCAGCHQFNGAPTSGGGGIASSYQAQLVAGNSYFGPFSDPAPGAPHASAAGIAFTQKNLTCANCHNVSLDRNHDGRITNGDDLVLQRTFDEYAQYRSAGGTETCITCHMPVMAGITNVAEGSNVSTPPRVVRDHSFVGVDYALDDAAHASSQEASREALLRSAARVRIDPATVARAEGLAFDVTMENTTTGHNVPSGFTFARQLWIEVRVSVNGSEVFRSGVLDRTTDDLCDASILQEIGNPMAQFMAGCALADESLVNLQTKLVEAVTVIRDESGLIVRDPEDGQPILAQANGASETVIQLLQGGVVARSRPQGGSLSPLRPFERRAFSYRVAGVDANAAVSIRVRLLFRHLPPYFLRALASAQPATEPALAPLVGNVRITELGSDTLDL